MRQFIPTHNNDPISVIMIDDLKEYLDTAYQLPTLPNGRFGPVYDPSGEESDGVPFCKVTMSLNDLPFYRPRKVTWECIVDLQTAQDCYYAELCRIHDESFIQPIGSGWKEMGYPFFLDRTYPVLRGITAQRASAIAAGQFLPGWKEIYSGDPRDLIHG